MRVEINFKSNYEDNNARLGGLEVAPVLQQAKAKNVELQKDIGFLKALRKINLWIKTNFLN